MDYLLEHPELIEPFRNGERWATSMVYRVYMPGVEKRLLNGFPGVSGLEDPWLIDEALQEVFRRAFDPKALLAYDGKRDYAGYLAGIARNVLVDMHRLRARERPVPTRDSSSELDLPQGPRIAQPEERRFDPKSEELIAAWAAKLEEPFRSYYIARFCSDDEAPSQEDLGERLGIGRKRVRTIEERFIAEARAMLRKAGLRDSNV